MHVHVKSNRMRTTIEIKPEHRARLLELAARRGEKGFSTIIAEAIEAHLRNQSARDQLTRRALRTKGRLRPEEAEELRKTVAEIRSHWR